jgi:hypothetical protein
MFVLPVENAFLVRAGKMAGYPEPVEKKFYDFFWLWI